VPKINKITVGSKWIFRHSKQKVMVRVFEIINGSVSYGLVTAVAGHITQTKKGFLRDYERIK